jgi:hypothetical protein
LILSILVLESAYSIRFLYRHFLSGITKKSLNAFYYACSYAKVDYSGFMNVTAKIALHLIPESLKSQPIFICIDDTMVSKFGLKFENVSKLFDHAAHNDSNYLNRQRRTTNATDMLIVNAYRNLLETSASIAKRFNVSDTYAHEVFNRYVKLDRLPLTDAISIDEVYLDMDDNCKYALVIQDFHTGDPIDLLRSRRVSVTEPYFTSIPPEERNGVKYLISDMYNQYIDYVDKYFPNAVPVVDSFHVIQWIIRMIDNHIRQLLKYYRQRDRERQEQLSLEEGRPISLPISDEVYLLKKYRWLILANQDNIHYHSEPRVDQHFHVLMNTYDYEDAIFHIDNKLKDYRELKEMYVRFNSINAGTPTAAREELIAFYANSEHSMFRAFEHFRNRFLYAARTTPILNGVTDYNPVTYFEDE